MHCGSRGSKSNRVTTLTHHTKNIAVTCRAGVLMKINKSIFSLVSRTFEYSFYSLPKIRHEKLISQKLKISNKHDLFEIYQKNFKVEKNKSYVNIFWNLKSLNESLCSHAYVTNSRRIQKGTNKQKGLSLLLERYCFDSDMMMLNKDKDCWKLEKNPAHWIGQSL